MREAGRPVNSKSRSNLLFKEKRQKLIFPDKMAHKNSPKTKIREAGRPVNSKSKSNLKAVGKRAQISPVQLQETNLTMISIDPDQHLDRKNG